MTASNMPAAEAIIDEALARGLLRDQHPELASLPIAPLGSGWDNVVFRLGEALTIRLPRRTLGAELLRNELKWLPVLGPRLPLRTPLPSYVGEPALGYPWPWYVGPWLPGEVAAVTPPSDPEAAAESLGRFLFALHREAPAEAPGNPLRGVPLSARDSNFRAQLEQLRGELGSDMVARCEALWTELGSAEPWRGPALWLHGDLHPANLLIDRGVLSGVIDFGDLCAGDPATDLAVAWMLLPAASRARLRQAAGRGDDEATWQRARAWALALGVATLANSKDHAQVRAMASRTLRNVMS